MSKTNLSIKYDGLSVQDGTMPVHELAPALLAIADLVQAANTEFNGNRARVSVNVTAPPKGGSFQIDLSVAQSILDQARGMLEGIEVSDAGKIVGAVFGVGGLLPLVKFLKGKRPRNIDIAINIGNRGDVTYTNVEGDQHVTTYHIHSLASDAQVQDNINAINRPLERQGVDLLKVNDADNTLQFEVDRKKGEELTIPEAGLDGTSIVSDSTESRWLAIATMAFEGGYIWRLRYPDETNAFSVHMCDEDFVKQVDSGETAFRKGDILYVELRTLQTRHARGVRTKRFVDRVMKHIPASENLKLPDFHIDE